MDTMREFFGRAAGNVALCYYRRSSLKHAPLERITDGELRACIFFATTSVALGGCLPQPRLQLTYQGE